MANPKIVPDSVIFVRNVYKEGSVLRSRVFLDRSMRDVNKLHFQNLTTHLPRLIKAVTGSSNVFLFVDYLYNFVLAEFFPTLFCVLLPITSASVQESANVTVYAFKDVTKNMRLTAELGTGMLLRLLYV